MEVNMKRRPISGKELFNRLHRKRSEVEAARTACDDRIIYDDYQLAKQAQVDGTLEIVDDPLLKNKLTGKSSDGKTTLLHTDCWKKMLASAQIVEKALPPEQLWLLNEKELGRYEGAACALRWVLGEHNEQLFSYLASDRFRG
jgi:hypothetical protein